MSYFKAFSPASLIAILLLTISTYLSAAPATEKSTYEAFSSLPTYWTPSLSPDGTKIAFVQNVEQEEAFAMLATYDLKKGEKHYLLRSDNELSLIHI